MGKKYTMKSIYNGIQFIKIIYRYIERGFKNVYQNIKNIYSGAMGLKITYTLKNSVII